jgi:hypothetical protein
MLFILIVKNHLHLKMELKLKQLIMIKNHGIIDFYLFISLEFFFKFCLSKLSEERLAQFRSLSEQPNVYELLSNAIGMIMFNFSRIL